VRAPVVEDVDCVLLRIANAPVTPNVPFTCNLYCGLVRPMPTLPLNSAIPTVPSAFILKLGIPEISDTLNIVPEDMLLLMENNCPDVPSKESELSSKTFNVIGAFVCPVKTILGYDVVFLLGVIRIFLSEFAIF
jgi:hypothetical protein